MIRNARCTAAWGLALVLALTACSSTPHSGHNAGVARSTVGVDAVSARAAFRAALAQVGQSDSMAADPPALRGYLLYPYLVAARLQAALASGHVFVGAAPSDARIAAFLQEQRGQPVARELAHAWLVSLASRQQWPTLLAHVGEFAGFAEDPVLACATVSARLATAAPPARETEVAAAASNGGDLASAALALWSQPIEQPACDGVFDWLRRNGLLTPERVEGRARAALAAGRATLALKLAAQLADADAAPLVEWAHLLQRPRTELRMLAQMPAVPVEPEALAAGVERLALSDSATAESLLPTLLMRPDITAELAGKLQRSVALGLAYDHAPGAAEALQQVPAAARDDTVREWGVRVALWTGMWPQARQWLDQLSAVAAAEPRWRYWRARVVAMLDGATAAAPLFAKLAGLRDYYGYLAADGTQAPYDLQAHPTPADPAVQAELATRPGVLRAHELFACGLMDAAALEWAMALQGATNAQRVQAAELADGWGWYTQAIAQLGRADDLDDVALRYPRPYADLVTRASALTDVPADWLLAVMRQESLFRADAVSRAHAQGLMQLLPTTASEVAVRWHLLLNGPDALFDPETAVTLGAAHLRELLDQYHGGIALALAAYNAGSAPVARWRPVQPMDADIWIENVAYGETREYVERVLEHIVAFSWSRGAPLPRLSSLLTVIQPEAVAASY